LNHVTLSKPQPVNKSSQLNSLVKAFIGQHSGQYSKTALRDTQGGLSGPFKVGKHQVAAAKANRVFICIDQQHCGAAKLDREITPKTG
jgi:hypothetical protein